MKLVFAIFTAVLAAVGNWWAASEIHINTALEDVARNPAEIAQELEKDTPDETTRDFLEEAEKRIALAKKLKTYTAGQTTTLKVKLAASGAILGFIGFYVIFGLTWLVTKPLEDALDNPMGIFTRYYAAPLVVSLILQFMVVGIALFPMLA